MVKLSYNYNTVLWHAKWATTDLNVRTRATLQIYRYLTGELPRIPKTALEVYGEIVNQYVQEHTTKLKSKVSFS